MTRKLLLLLAAVLLLWPAAPAGAHEVVPVRPAITPGGPPEIQLQSLRVTAAVDQGVARVTVDQVFVNRTQANAEGTYLFPLPPGASLSSFQMFVDGQAYSAEVMDAAKAREIYEGIVRRNRDPAILQYVGQGLLQARVFPVPPGAERQIRVEYSQVLPREGGLAELALPLGSQPVPQVSIVVDVKQAGSAALYSPTHTVAVVRNKDGSARASFEGTGVRGDFRLFLGADDQRMDVNLLTFKSSGENGYFLLLANPPASASAEVAAKDVILVLDLSGSMAGEKWVQARDAALQILGSLGGDDRFAVIGFHSDTLAYADQLRGAREAGEAMAWVRGLSVGGATNISEATSRAQRIAGKAGGRPQAIILITDGQPTAGETNADRIVQQVREQSAVEHRLFTFGVGYDVNTMLLDAVAQENRGRSDYVKPGENLESAVSGLWRKVGQPVLVDLSLEWSGVQVEEIYPRPLGDMYLGSQMVLVGRYRKGGEGNLTIRGKVNGETRSYKFTDLAFTDRDTARDYIPRLWATRKVGYLLSEIRLRGADKEAVDEVVALAQRFGIVTPYTSFFVPEPNQPAAAPGNATAAADSVRKIAAEQKAAPAGQAAVENAKSVQSAKEAAAVQAPAGAAAGQLRTAGDKTFVLRAGIWTDTAYTGGELTHLKVGSDRYLDVVRKRPDLARYFAAGSPLIVADGDTNWGIDIGAREESDVSLPEAVAPKGDARNGGARPVLLMLVAAGFAVAGGTIWRYRRKAAA